MSMEEPKPKKAKVVKEEPEGENDDTDEYDEKELGEESKDTNQNTCEAMRNDAGEAYFELTAKRRVTVRKFKGSVLVDFREFYEKGGKSLPGKKGISLTVEQYTALAEVVKGGAIEQEIERLSQKK